VELRASMSDTGAGRSRGGMDDEEDVLCNDEDNNE